MWEWRLCPRGAGALEVYRAGKGTSEWKTPAGLFPAVSVVNPNGGWSVLIRSLQQLSEGQLPCLEFLCSLEAFRSLTLHWGFLPLEYVDLLLFGFCPLILLGCPLLWFSTASEILTRL